MKKSQNEKFKEIAPEFYEVLSSFGKKILLPDGVVSQSIRAKSEAKKINATIGIATTEQGAMFFKGIKEFFPHNKASDIFPYAATCGRNSLRALWKQKIFNENPSLKGKTFHDPIVVQGLTHGTNILAELFLNPGDKIILPDFSWENYDFIFQTKFQAEIVKHSFFLADGFHFAALRKTLFTQQEQKIMLVFNFPHNPTGYAPSTNEVEKITEILLEAAKKGKKLIVVCDDSYFGLNYEENICPESLFGRVAGLHPNLIAAKLDGVTKEFYAWGFRVGFLSLAFASSDYKEAFFILEKKIQGLIRAELSSMSHPIQTIIEQYLLQEKFSLEKAENKKILQERYQKLKKILVNSKYQKAWEYYPFNSGYFLCIKIKEKVSAKILWELLLKKYQVGVIYLGEQNLRIAYSSVPVEKLEPLLEAIYSAYQELC